MVRVVRNLLDNAIRHTPPGARSPSRADVDEDGSDVEVSVLDGCGGIPAEDIDRVFEMGYRGDLARTPGEGRGGLGLAVAQGLVRRPRRPHLRQQRIRRVPLHGPLAPPPPDQGTAANRLTGTVQPERQIHHGFTNRAPTAGGNGTCS